jgi:hypothetical protein
MGKRATILVIAVLALMLAGIAFAVSRLYGDTSTDPPRKAEPGAAWEVLKAVPADAVLVTVFDGSKQAARILADSTGLVQAVLSPGNPALMDYLRTTDRSRMAVSLHNSGSLVPLVVTELQQLDSASLVPVLAAADKAGLKTQMSGGFLLASRSETFLNASVRHLEEGMSVLATDKLQDLVAVTSGPVSFFFSHSHAAKILQVYTPARMRRNASFVKDLSAWSSLVVQESADDHLLLKGAALPGDAPASWFAAFEGLPVQEAAFPEVLPYFTSKAFSLPVADAESFLACLRRYEDGNGRLTRYNNTLKARSGRPLSPEEWFRSLQPKELVKASFTADDGVAREVVLVRSAKDQKLGQASSNAYKGYLQALLGEPFSVVDTSCASVGSHWSVFGDGPAVAAFAEKPFLDYTLKDRLSDASVSVPSGVVAYNSFTENPEMASELFSGELLEQLSAFVRGSGYAPAFLGLDLSGGNPGFRIRVDKRALKGTKVQVLERDTTVVVPTGLFPVQNYQTGKTNYLYQNDHLSICLNDENGKGVWGIPFKERLCGKVENIDYYNNGKIQFLFCAGTKLYLLDRLGHWVNGFPVELGKPVLLGPAAYDFTGAKGYTVMVLHKDNSLEMYNLHGQKPADWKGLHAPETVKSLPELVEVNGKSYWVVRTSVRSLVYGFYGGDPLTRDEGGKMIKPDSPVTPKGKGVTVECYDGKTRDIKLN